jgi:hypothetical protein
MSSFRSRDVKKCPTLSLVSLGKLLKATNCIFRTIDMLHAFLLFWPATVLPLFLLITLLQFFIPMNMLFRMMMGLQHHKIHITATVIILLATTIGILGVGRMTTDPNQFAYSLVFLVGGVMLALSHNLKESIVRR